MHGFQGVFQVIAGWVFRLGGIGLFAVGVVDSSILMAPLANDLLVIALAATHPQRMCYYAAMAAAGSTAGCAITDMLSRKAEESVRKLVRSKRFKFVEKRMKKHAGWTLALAAVIPPPFPFTPFVAIAAGAGFSRKKLLGTVLGARFVRFAVEGLLALKYGKGILNLAKAPAVEYTIIGLIVIAVVGSGISIYRWVRQGKSAAHRTRDTERG